MPRTFLFVFILMLTACHDDDDDKAQDYSDCLQNTVDNYVINYPKPLSQFATISKYSYKGQVLFIFDPGSGFADWLFSAVDNDCQSVCEFGGIAGIQTCNDWDTEAKLIKIVWQDNR